MITAAPRYLLFDVETTRLSCIDSGYIQNIASNLIFRIPFLLPIMKDDKYGIEKWEAFLKVYDKFPRSIKVEKGIQGSQKEEALRLEPGLSHDIVGALSMDGWGIDVFRLCALNAPVCKRGRGRNQKSHRGYRTYKNRSKGQRGKGQG